MINILVDRHIAQAGSAFSSLGHVVLFDPPVPGREQLRDCDMLMVRSVTCVDGDLLAGTPVRFVGTATSGVDHVDVDYLTEQGIAFVDAAGSNARPVAEYVLSALSVLLERRFLAFSDVTVGIIGYGHVGSSLHRLLRPLGVTCLINDPPLAAAGVDADFRPLDEVLQADVVSLHVPFTEHGRWPTQHLLDAERLQRLPPGAILINTARGGVIDEAALKALQPERELCLVLDVWDGEPAIDVGLVKQALLATPHIAGYSLEAKLRATRMLRAAAAAWCGSADDWTPAVANDTPRRLPLDGIRFEEGARLAILASYDVRSDTAAMRRIGELESLARVDYFRGLRDAYTLRREFSATWLALDAGHQLDAECYRQLGFQVEIT